MPGQQRPALARSKVVTVVGLGIDRVTVRNKLLGTAKAVQVENEMAEAVENRSILIPFHAPQDVVVVRGGLEQGVVEAVWAVEARGAVE